MKLRGIDGTDTALRSACSLPSPRVRVEREIVREIFLELTGMHESSFFSAVRELYSLRDSERDAAKARTGGNLRGEHAILSPAIEREERSRARGLSLTRSDGFSKNFRPGPSSLLFRFTAKGRRDAPKSPRERANTHRINLCRSLALSRRRSARTLGRAARLIEGPTFCKDHVGKEKASCERNENDYPERWITWLVGR